jgi:predicted ribosome quality control (RQC) complex YloA/Tae2 family protein
MLWKKGEGTIMGDIVSAIYNDYKKYIAFCKKKDIKPLSEFNNFYDHWDEIKDPQKYIKEKKKKINKKIKKLQKEIKEFKKERKKL